MVKEFEIQGRICNLPPEMTEEEFWHTVIGFIEENGWSFGGGLEMEKISGCVSDTSPDMTVEEFEKTFLGFVERNRWSFEGSIAIYNQAGTATVMAKQHLFGFMVEIDEVSTHRWYADAEEWGCDCGDCRNFLALARKRQLPTFVLEQLDKLGIPPENSFDIALQNEFSLEESIALARQFVSEQLVGRGMIADFAIHLPDKEDGGIPNPHFHVLCPIRPIEPDGKWGCKQRRRYRLDEDGNSIMGEDGKPLFDAVPTTDWGSPETLEHWREEWAAMVNAKFEEKGLTCRVDHRSYERQGLDLLPTIHEGVAVRQMEAKGITTDKGDFNRWIKKANNLLRDIRKKIASLTDWIKAIKEELSQPQAPTLATLLTDYYEGRNAGAWSRNARIGNLKDFAEAVNFLTERGIATLEDLEAHIATQSERVEAINTSMKAKSARLNELKELLRLVDLYRDTKPIYDEWKGIKWKGKREQFEREHESELRTFHMAHRKLDKHRSPAGKIPAHAWEQEQARLHQEYTAEYEQYKPIQDDLRRLQQVKRNANAAIRQQEQTQQKRREVER